MSEFPLILSQLILLLEFGIWYRFRKQLGVVHEKLFQLIDDIKITFFPVQQTIIIPVIGTIFIWGIWRMGMHFYPEHITKVPLDTLYIVSVVVMSPIVETLVLAVTINFLIPYSQDLKSILSKFIFIAILMGLLHQPQALISLVTRAIVFLYFIFIYYYSGRNLIPPIISHAIWAILIII